MKGYMTKVVVTLLLSIMAILLVGSSWNDAPTVDEPTHIFAGLTYVKFRDLRQNPEHPPLVKWLSGLSLGFLYPSLNFPYSFEQLAPALEFSITDYAANMFRVNDPTKYLLIARLPVLAITLFGGTIVYLLSTKLGGNKAGVFSLLLYVFEPNIIAHGRLVTTDAALMVFTLTTIYCFVRYQEKLGKTWLLLSFLACGILVLTKYSALLVLPLILLAYILAANMTKAHLRSGLIVTVGSLLASVLVIWAFYALFRPNDFPYQDSAKIQNLMASVQPDWLVNGLLTQSLLPAYYRHGVRIVAAHAYYGQQFFLAGDFGNFNKLYLYPKIFLLKTPLSLLFFFFTCFFIYKTQWNSETMKQSRFLTLFLLLTALGYTLILLTSNIFFGIRNVLPFSAILIILSGASINWWLKRGKRVLIFVILVALYVLESLFTFPSYLSYGNQLFGGREKKMAAMADSNIDWGQDLKRLSFYLREKNITTLPFHYFGTAPPETYGIKALRLPTREEGKVPTGYVAVSVSNQNYAYRIEENGKVRFLFKAYNYLDNIEPVNIIGDSIVVYYLP